MDFFFVWTVVAEALSGAGIEMGVGSIVYCSGGVGGA